MFRTGLVVLALVALAVPAFAANLGPNASRLVPHHGGPQTAISSDGGANAAIDTDGDGNPDLAMNDTTNTGDYQGTDGNGALWWLDVEANGAYNLFIYDAAGNLTHIESGVVQ